MTSRIHSPRRAFSRGSLVISIHAHPLHLHHSEIEHLIRFFAHLVLFLPMLDIHVDSTAANDILQAYIVILQTEGNEQLVAQYAAEMESGSAEYSYAAFLRGMLVWLGGTAVWRGS
jgi:hypothetical protein